MSLLLSDWSPGPREEQPVLLSAEPVLQTSLLFLTGNVTASE